MAELLRGDFWLVFWAAAFALFIVLPIQLTLCFRAKKLFVKSLPAVLAAGAAIAFYVLARIARTWIAFIYLIVAFYAALFLISCGIAWSIWVVYTLCANRNRRGMRG